MNRNSLPVQTLLWMTVVGLLVGGLVATAPLAVTADDPADDPQFVIASYYGTVTIDDDPAPPGTTITAVVDGTERGSTTVAEDGAFGSVTADGPSNLLVEGSTDDLGSHVTFLVEGVEADTDPASITVDSMDFLPQHVDLSVELDDQEDGGDAGDEDGGDAGDKDGGDAGDGGGNDHDGAPTGEDDRDVTSRTGSESSSEDGETTADDESESTERAESARDADGDSSTPADDTSDGDERVLATEPDDDATVGFGGLAAGLAVLVGASVLGLLRRRGAPTA